MTTMSLFFRTVWPLSETAAVTVFVPSLKVARGEPAVLVAENIFENFEPRPEIVTSALLHALSINVKAAKNRSLKRGLIT
jgi:hypothetical protein